MLTYIPLSKDNLEEAIDLVYSVFPDDANSMDDPAVAYRASIDKEGNQDFIQRHHLETLQYFIVKNFPDEKIVGVTGWYTEARGPKDIIWLGWYCIDPNERGKGFGKEILEWTIGKVKEMGYRVMKLYTTTDPNEAAAQILYEKIGFKLIGEEQEEGRAYLTLFREKVL